MIDYKTVKTVKNIDLYFITTSINRGVNENYQFLFQPFERFVK